MSDDISFDEFKELCEDAGISVDNTAVLEQDYRAGRALADVTDALIVDHETHPDAYSAGEAITKMETYSAMLSEGEDLKGAREVAIRLAVQAIRYLAECTHDEGQN